MSALVLFAAVVCAAGSTPLLSAADTPGGDAESGAFPRKGDIGNPHHSDEHCLTCHNHLPSDPKEVSFRNTVDGVVQWSALCTGCHCEGEATLCIHPPGKAGNGASIPRGWPTGEGGSLICVTCHCMAYGGLLDSRNPKYLRGGPYAYRTGICWECHSPAAFRTTDPHVDYDREESCTLCHLENPEETGETDLKADTELLCLRCHDDLPHPAGIDHTGLPGTTATTRVPGAVFPLDYDSRIACPSCHEPHGAFKDRPSTVRGRWTRSKSFCQGCHIDY